MIGTINSAASRLRTLWDNRNGAVAVIAAVTLSMFLGLAGLTIDMGNFMTSSSRLRAVTDAAAMAGANALIQPNATPTDAINAATAWVTANSGPALGSPTLKVTTSCVTNVANLPNCSASVPNVVTVAQTGTVPGLLSSVVGFKGVFSVAAKASASKAGGAAVPLNIMFVLDATPSMNSADPGTGTYKCTVPGISSPSHLQCALYGIEQVMNVMVTPQDKVGIMVFPGYQNALTSVCTNTTNPTVVKYFTPNMNYTLAALASDYSTTPGVLNTGSDLVKVAQSYKTTGTPCFGPSRTSYGSYMAEAVTAAQAKFPQVAGTQNVLIILSDGEANLSDSDMYCLPGSGVTCPQQGAAWIAHGSKQCDATATAANLAKNATGAAGGTWVYSVAYGASTGPCPSGGSTPCKSMQNAASDVSRFFTTDITCKWTGAGTQTNPANSMPNLLKQIAYTLNKARLIPSS